MLSFKILKALFISTSQSFDTVSDFGSTVTQCLLDMKPEIWSLVRINAIIKVLFECQYKVCSDGSQREKRFPLCDLWL